MRRIRIFALGIVSFFAVLMGALLAPGTFVNRALSAALCTVFSFSSTVCTVNLAKSSDRVVAATPPAVERNIEDWLVRDPGEFDDAPSVPDGSNPQAPPFPQDPGPNQPVRPDFDNRDQNPTNTSPRQTQPVATEIIAFEAPSVRELSPDTFELALVSKEGCRSASIIKQQNGQVFQQSITLTSPGIDICGYESSTANLSPDGKQFEVRVNGSSASLSAKLEGDNSAIITYTSPTGESRSIKAKVPSNSTSLKDMESSNKIVSTSINRFSYQKNTNLNNYPNPTYTLISNSTFAGGITQNNSSGSSILKKRCDGLNEFCLRVGQLGTLFAGVEVAGGLAVAAGLVSAATLTPLFLASGVTFFLVGTGCTLLTGGLPSSPTSLPVPKPINQVNGLGFLYSVVALEVTKRGIPVPPVNALRKQLGLDFCDPKPQQDAPQTAQSPTPESSQQPQDDCNANSNQGDKPKSWSLDLPCFVMKNGHAQSNGYCRERTNVTEQGNSISGQIPLTVNGARMQWSLSGSLSGMVATPTGNECAITFENISRVTNGNKLVAINGTAKTCGVSGSFHMRNLNPDDDRSKQQCPPPKQQPQQTAPVVTARISQVDDVARIYVDGKIVFEGFYAPGGKGGDTGWQPINVGSGRHQVRLAVENTQSGESGGWFEIKVNGELKINQGRPFQKDRITGIKYDQTTTLEVP